MGILILAGLASPALRPLLEQKPAIVKKEEPKPAPVIPVPVVEPAPEPEPEPEPAFLFVPPPGLATASPRQFHIADVQSIAGPEASEPFALAPDNRQVAFTANSGGSVQIRVVDLHTLTDTASFPISRTPKAIAWSPDSKRLAILGDDDLRPLAVGDIETQKLTWLPRPAARQLPRAPSNELRWKTGSQVAVVGGDQERLIDIETLLVEFAFVETKAKAADASGAVGPRPNSGTPVHGRSRPHSEAWTFASNPGSRSFDLGSGPLAPLLISGPPMLEVTSKAFDSTQPFSEFTVANPGSFRYASDGSLILSLAAEGLKVYYMGLRDDQPSGFTVECPLPVDDALTKVIREHRLTALVCPPLVNPLNDEIVGADLTRILAFGRVSEWKDGKISFWLDHQVAPVSESDVVACLCAAAGNTITPLEAPDFHRWWSPIREFSADPECSPPALKAPSVGETADVTKAMRDSPDPSLSKTEPLPVISPPTMEGEMVEGTANPRPAKPRAITEADIRKFIVAHHAKYTREDLDGILTDYAPTVAHYHGGANLSRAKVRSELAQTFGSLDISETVSKEIAVGRADRGFSASYGVISVGKKRDVVLRTEWRYDLAIETTSGKPQIIAERAVQIR